MKKHRLPTARVYGEQCYLRGVCFDETFGKREKSDDTYAMSLKTAYRVLREMRLKIRPFSPYLSTTARSVVYYYLGRYPR